MDSSDNGTSLFLLDLQIFLISANLNSGLIFIFFIGLYTTIYLGTMYLYITHRQNNRILVATIVTILYVIAAILLGFQWKSLVTTFVTQADTRLSIFISSETTQSAVAEMITSCLGYIQLILAQGLLVWRCYHMYNDNIRVLSIPLLLYALEILLSIAGFVITAESRFNPIVAENANWGRASNAVGSTLSVVSAVSSLTSTLLICRRIYIGAAGSNRSRRQYMMMLRILIESCALYTISVIASAVFVFLIPARVERTVKGATPIAVAIYLATFVTVSTSLAPTLMVARIALNSSSSSSNTTSSVVLPSDLRFKSSIPDSMSVRMEERGEARSIV